MQLSRRMELQACGSGPPRSLAETTAGRAGGGKRVGRSGRGLAAPVAASRAAAGFSGGDRVPPRLASGARFTLRRGPAGRADSEVGWVGHRSRFAIAAI